MIQEKPARPTKPCRRAPKSDRQMLHRESEPFVKQIDRGVLSEDDKVSVCVSRRIISSGFLRVS